MIELLNSLSPTFLGKYTFHRNGWITDGWKFRINSHICIIVRNYFFTNEYVLYIDGEMKSAYEPHFKSILRKLKKC